MDIPHIIVSQVEAPSSHSSPTGFYPTSTCGQRGSELSGSCNWFFARGRDTLSPAFCRCESSLQSSSGFVSDKWWRFSSTNVLLGSHWVIWARARRSSNSSEFYLTDFKAIKSQYGVRFNLLTTITRATIVKHPFALPWSQKAKLDSGPVSSAFISLLVTSRTSLPILILQLQSRTASGTQSTTGCCARYWMQLATIPLHKSFHCPPWRLYPILLHFPVCFVTSRFTISGISAFYITWWTSQIPSLFLMFWSRIPYLRRLITINYDLQESLWLLDINFSAACKLPVIFIKVFSEAELISLVVHQTQAG